MSLQSWSHLTKFDYRMKGYLLVMWRWNLHLDFFDDGWGRYMRASFLWMILFQMRKPFLNRKRLLLLIGMICCFLGWYSSRIRRWSLLDYNLDDDNAFLPSICFSFFCRVGQDCLNLFQDDEILILRSFEFHSFVDILMRVLVMWRHKFLMWSYLVVVDFIL